MRVVLAVGSKDTLAGMKDVPGVQIVPVEMIRFDAISFAIPEDVRFDWVFFGSKRGATFFLESVGVDFLKSMKVGCVGSKTEAVLTRNGVAVDFVPTQFSSTFWPGEFVEQYGGNECNILLPTSNRSRFETPDVFVEQGIHVRRLEIYRTVCTGYRVQVPFDGVIFASPSCFRCFVEANQNVTLKSKTIVAIGDISAKVIRKSGLSCAVPDSFTMNEAVKKCASILTEDQL